MIGTSLTGQVYSQSTEDTMGKSGGSDDENYWKLTGYGPLSPSGRAYEQWGLKLFGLDKEDVGYDPDEMCPCCAGEAPPPSGVRRCFNPPPEPASTVRYLRPKKRKL